MLLKILGIADLIAALSYWIFSFFGIIPISFITFAALYLIMKGVIFSLTGDAVSIGDIIAGVVIFSSLNFTFPQIVPIIVSLYLIQKAIFSLLS